MPTIVPVRVWPGLALALEFGAIFLGGAVQDALRSMTQAAGPPPQRVLVGMAQHHFVQVNGNMRRI